MVSLVLVTSFKSPPLIALNGILPVGKELVPVIVMSRVLSWLEHMFTKDEVYTDAIAIDILVSYVA